MKINIKYIINLFVFLSASCQDDMGKKTKEIKEKQVKEIVTRRVA